MPTLAVRNKRIKEFKEVAGTISDSTATSVLEANNWEVEKSVNYFFANRHLYPEVKSGDAKTLQKIFSQYADNQDTNIMSEQGMIKFFKDVGVDPEGYETLAIAWNINASEMGLFQKQEFIDGFTKTGCTSIADIKKVVQQVTQSLKEEDKFKEFYKWLFVHAREDDKKKTISRDLALQLWRIVLGNKNYSPKYPLLDSWLKFVESNNENQAISRDVWEQLIDFLKETKKADEYDDNGAWPVLIDEFMEHLAETKDS